VASQVVKTELPEHFGRHHHIQLQSNANAKPGQMSLIIPAFYIKRI